MDIRPIRTDADLTEALREIDRLWGAPVGTLEGDKLDVLATLAEAYERAQHPVPESDPVELLHFAIDEMGRSQVELAELLGSRSRASEILNRKRPLTIEMVRKLHTEWKLPADLLIQPYEIDYEITPLKKRPQVARDARTGAFVIKKKSGGLGQKRKVGRKRPATKQ